MSTLYVADPSLFAGLHEEQDGKRTSFDAL